MKTISIWLKVIALLLLAISCYAWAVETGLLGVLILAFFIEMSAWYILGRSRRRKAKNQNQQVKSTLHSSREY